MITKMVKLCICGPRDHLPGVTSLLQELGVLHIESPGPPRLFFAHRRLTVGGVVR